MEIVVGTLELDASAGGGRTRHAHGDTPLKEILVGRGAIIAPRAATDERADGVPSILRRLPRSEFSVSPSATLLTTTPSDAYDFLYADSCLQHCDDPYATLTDWIRVVRPGGSIVFTVPLDLADGSHDQRNWAFALPSPAPLGEHVVGIFDLLVTVCHLAEPVDLSALTGDEQGA